MLLCITFFLWMLNIHVTIESSVDFDGLENVAVNAGEKFKFTCKATSNLRLRWSMKAAGENNELILTREGRILPNFARDYYAEASNGKLTLSTGNASLHMAGRYICLEISTSKTSSAELIVIESAPICNSTQNTSLSVLRCDVKYRGNWYPDIDLSIQNNGTAQIRSLQGQLTSQLIVLHFMDHKDFYYACTVKFSRNGTTAKIFDAEKVNEVVGTVARNIPEYITTTVCPYSPAINCGVRLHLATALFVVAYSILASLL